LAIADLSDSSLAVLNRKKDRDDFDLIRRQAQIGNGIWQSAR
jgi:hypothetical protein